jgi:hypothetical protein
VTALPEEQLAPNNPSLSRLVLPIAARWVSIGVASLLIACSQAEFDPPQAERQFLMVPM